ncbi:hypothetical protein [Ilyobacter polytropus]|uniref:Uncharacterized protein n=1 Tax=Ilyobacter polytropus (strain ATCC 51220 / DSM 2926 / LMG 16218 / CuHBu1) TaxID=572544 RepID=E3H9N7_ILYPC|nr:hypothetical protein [Ilyobacter polytropus]ADO83426.1 hypothetical protein Ilyop_1653 [Ilyobacter polytropus DSM 2926]
MSNTEFSKEKLLREIFEDLDCCEKEEEIDSIDGIKMDTSRFSDVKELVYATEDLEFNEQHIRKLSKIITDGESDELTIGLNKIADYVIDHYYQSLAPSEKDEGSITFADFIKKGYGENKSINFIKENLAQEIKITEEDKEYKKYYYKIEKRLNKINGLTGVEGLYSKKEDFILSEYIKCDFEDVTNKSTPIEEIYKEISKKYQNNYSHRKISKAGEEDLRFLLEEVVDNAALKKIISGKKVNEKSLLELEEKTKEFFKTKKNFNETRANAVVNRYFGDYRKLTSKEEKINKYLSELIDLTEVTNLLIDYTIDNWPLGREEELREKEKSRKKLENIKSC